MPQNTDNSWCSQWSMMNSLAVQKSFKRGTSAAVKGCSIQDLEKLLQMAKWRRWPTEWQETSEIERQTKNWTIKKQSVLTWIQVLWGAASHEMHLRKQTEPWHVMLNTISHYRRNIHFCGKKWNLKQLVKDCQQQTRLRAREHCIWQLRNTSEFTLCRPAFKEQISDKQLMNSLK